MADKRAHRRKPTNQEAHRRQRQAQALELRRMGASYRAIATEMHIATATAYTYVMDALKEITREPAEQVRQLHLDRYDQLLMAHFPQAAMGDPIATDKCLQILTRIELLNGVKAPAEADDTARAVSLLARLADQAHNIITQAEETPTNQE